MNDANNQFSPRAKHVLELARKQAGKLKHDHIGTEHLLLALIELKENTAMQVLAKIGVKIETLNEILEKYVCAGPDNPVIGNVLYTPRVKKIFSLAGKIAKEMDIPYLGTEHILLGLLKEGDGIAAKVLKEAKVEFNATSKVVSEVLGLTQKTISEQKLACESIINGMLSRIPGLLNDYASAQKIDGLFISFITLLRLQGCTLEQILFHQIVRLLPLDFDYFALTQNVILAGSENIAEIISYVQQLYDDSESGTEVEKKLGIILQILNDNKPVRKHGPEVDYLKDHKQSTAAT